MQRHYVADRLVRDSARGPRLLGGRSADGAWVFPFPQGPAGDSFELAELPDRGSLWSFTIQRFPPKPPYVPAGEPFEPYAVGYVELPGTLIVESRLMAPDPAALQIGMPMQLTVIPVFRDAQGEQVFTYAFEPAAGAKAPATGAQP